MVRLGHIEGQYITTLTTSAAHDPECHDQVLVKKLSSFYLTQEYLLSNSNNNAQVVLVFWTTLSDTIISCFFSNSNNKAQVVLIFDNFIWHKNIFSIKFEKKRAGGGSKVCQVGWELGKRLLLAHSYEVPQLPYDTRGDFFDILTVVLKDNVKLCSFCFNLTTMPWICPPAFAPVASREDCADLVSTLSAKPSPLL